MSSIESAGLVGTAERTFLTPKNLEMEEMTDVPSLDEFDSEIQLYRVCSLLLRYLYITRIFWTEYCFVG